MDETIARLVVRSQPSLDGKMLGKIWTDVLTSDISIPTNSLSACLDFPFIRPSVLQWNGKNSLRSGGQSYKGLVIRLLVVFTLVQSTWTSPAQTAVYGYSHWNFTMILPSQCDCHHQGQNTYANQAFSCPSLTGQKYLEVEILHWSSSWYSLQDCSLLNLQYFTWCQLGCKYMSQWFEILWSSSVKLDLYCYTVSLVSFIGLANLTEFEPVIFATTIKFVATLAPSSWMLSYQPGHSYFNWWRALNSHHPQSQ